MLREFSYSSFRFGLYKPLKSILKVRDDNLLGKIASGASSGSIGSVMAVPTDRLKIRMQCEAGAVNSKGMYTTGLRKGSQQSYPTINLFRAFKMMHDKEGGVPGLWKGWQPTVARAGLLAGAQLSTYDHSKYKLRSVLGEGTVLHVACSIVASVATTIVTQPADTVKSVMMADPTKSIGDVTGKLFREEGTRGFYRGAFASWARFGPHFVIALPLWERVRWAMGLGYT